MQDEYVKLSNEEKTYAYKSLLHSELEFLNMMKSFRNYMDLRNKEFALKVSLKSKIGEALAEMEKLDGLLPKTHIKEEKIIDFDRTPRKGKKKVSEDEALISEINSIKEKLLNLQRGM